MDLGTNIREDVLLLERLREEGVDRRQLLLGQFRQGHPEIVRDRQLGGNPRGKGQLVQRVGVDKRLDGEDRRLCQRQRSSAALDSRTGQQQLRSEDFQAFHTLLDGRFLEPAVPVERDRAANGMVGAVALLAMLDIQFLIEEPLPEDDRFACEVGVHRVRHPLHNDPGVDAHFPAFGLTGKRTEALPVAHGTEARGRQVLAPVL